MSGARVNSSQLDRELACRGWSASDLARAAGISAATVSAARRASRWLQGRFERWRSPWSACRRFPGSRTCSSELIGDRRSAAGDQPAGDLQDLGSAANQAAGCLGVALHTGFRVTAFNDPRI